MNNKNDYMTFRDNVITPTLNTPTVITPTLITPTIITPTLNTSTVTDSLCNSGAFSNPNAVQDCPFILKDYMVENSKDLKFPKEIRHYILIPSGLARQAWLLKWIFYNVAVRVGRVCV
jgi:hypothetical protein